MEIRAPLEFITFTESHCVNLEPHLTHVVVPTSARRERVSENASGSSSEEEDMPVVDVVKVNEQPLPYRPGRNYDPNRYTFHWHLRAPSTFTLHRYRLHFEQESKEAIEERKQLARTVPIIPLPEVSF